MKMALAKNVQIDAGLKAKNTKKWLSKALKKDNKTAGQTRILKIIS